MTYSMGIDIGTTSISVTILDDEGRTIDSVTHNNRSFMTSQYSWESIQDPRIILKDTEQIVTRLEKQYPQIQRIGFTGQMHGILYLDAKGRAVSPLYTWQDQRGNQKISPEESYAEYLSRTTGHPLATGFGCVTHFYNLENKLVPENAVTFCSICDYIAIQLAQLQSPIPIHSSFAASFGLFDAEQLRFDQKALSAVGIPFEFLPKTTSAVSCIGKDKNQIPVYNGIGDNQASFLGSVDSLADTILVNVGTGSQVSLYTAQYLKSDRLETRPFLDGSYLLVGSSLCGGRAFALLETFFRSTVQLMTGQVCQSCYPAIDRILAEFPQPDDPITVHSQFSGTRGNPDVRGSIEGIDTHNFTPVHLIYGMLEGIARELYDFCRRDISMRPCPIRLTGSGNGLRKNRALQKIVEQTFRAELAISPYQEEAARGAALSTVYSHGNQ